MEKHWQDSDPCQDESQEHYAAITLYFVVDGFIAAADGNTNWMLWNWGPEWRWDNELQQYHNALTLSVD